MSIDRMTLDARRRARHENGRSGAQQRVPNKLQRRKAAEIADARELAHRWLDRIGDRDLLIAGIALYAGEGAKTDGGVRFANSDPRMISLFLCWLRQCFDIDESRLRVRLYLHEGLDLAAATTFWAELTAIGPEQFSKPYRARADASIRRSKHPMGCPSIIYSCSRTHRLVMGLTDALLSSNGSEPG